MIIVGHNQENVYTLFKKYIWLEDKKSLTTGRKKKKEERKSLIKPLKYVSMGLIDECDI